MSALRRTTVGCLAIVLCIFLCTMGMTLTFDRVCFSYLTQRLPYYPNATLRWETHNLLTGWGMGNTVAMLDSEDAPDVVRSWYGRHTGTFLRAIANSSDTVMVLGQRLGRVEWVVDRAENGTGSLITLHATCVN